MKRYEVVLVCLRAWEHSLCSNFRWQLGRKVGVDHLGTQVESDSELAEMNARLGLAALPKET